MATQIAKDDVTGPLGRFRVSTIRTLAGGGEVNVSAFSPFDDTSYADETPWPFETMIFSGNSSVGLYHAPYETEEESLAGHKLMVETIKKGAEFGGGVQGPQGIPSMTPTEWRAKVASKVSRGV